MFTVIITAGVLFVSAQNAKLDSNSLLAQNIEALGREESGELWDRDDEDCTYSGTGKRNSTIKVTIGGVEHSVGTNSEGEWTYTVEDGQTHCTSGGHEQCTAQYC